jgi:Fur family zinc uptake transcriptional regulator
MHQTHICAHNHAHVSSDILAEAERYCESAGLRLTDQRRRVLALLAESATPLGAYDLLDRAAKDAAKRIAPIAIYRALDFLLEAGLIHRLESRNAFIVCPHRHGHSETVVFMICETCGRVDEAFSPDITKDLLKLSGQRGFSLSAKVIELAGLCRLCAPASS